MKKVFKVLGIVLLVVIALYLVSIVIIRKKNPIRETTFFTPTPYNKHLIFNQLDDSYLTHISKDSILYASSRFIDSKKDDSIILNQTRITRNLKKFSSDSISEFYTIAPTSYKKVGIFMLGNTFNVFNLLDQLTELAKQDSIKIYVITYNASGYSQGKPSIESQFNVNQKFYNYIRSNEKVDLIMGHSLGSVFASKLAVNDTIPNLVLLAPVSNLSDIIAYFKSASSVLLIPYFNTSKLTQSGIDTLADNLEMLKKYHGNLLMMHGTADANLPYQMSEKILKSCPSSSKKLILVPNGDHYVAFRKDNWNKLIEILK